MKKYLPDIFLLILGPAVMGLVIYFMAQSDGVPFFLGIVALALVWITWYSHLLRLAFRKLGVQPDDEDDLPSFPG